MTGCSGWFTVANSAEAENTDKAGEEATCVIYLPLGFFVTLN